MDIYPEFIEFQEPGSNEWPVKFSHMGITHYLHPSALNKILDHYCPIKQSAPDPAVGNDFEWWAKGFESGFKMARDMFEKHV